MNGVQHECPAVHHILLTYALATIITSLAGMITGNRYFTRLITCYCFGGKEGKAWMFMWFVQLWCFFGGDLLVAYLTIHAPGYSKETMPTIGQLALFYTTRPRIAFIFLGVLGFHSMWEASAKQIMISESLMQVLGTYYLGRTAHFAAANGYYSVNAADTTMSRLMYAGALLTLLATFGSIAGLVLALFSLTRREYFEAKAFILFGLSLGFGAFVGRWLFLIGYLELAQDRYVLLSPILSMSVLYSVTLRLTN